jgi:hypothetical protein
MDNELTKQDKFLALVLFTIFVVLVYIFKLS